MDNLFLSYLTHTKECLTILNLIWRLPLCLALVCTHTFCTRMHTHTHMCAHSYMHAHTHSDTHACTHTHTQPHAHTHTHSSTCACTHTHTHTQTQCILSPSIRLSVPTSCYQVKHRKLFWHQVCLCLHASVLSSNLNFFFFFCLCKTKLNPCKPCTQMRFWSIIQMIFYF